MYRSPLGQIFDHGCDSINSMFGSANWLINMGINPCLDPLITWIVVFGPIAQFFVSTWEEYYNGSLILPIVNGPSEGLLLGSMLSLTSYIYGNTFWQATTWCDMFLFYISENYDKSTVHSYIVPLRNCDIVVLAATIGFIQEITMKVFTVSKKHGFRKCVQDLLPLLQLCLGYFMVGYLTPSLSSPRAMPVVAAAAGEQQGQPQQPNSYNNNIWFAMPRTSLAIASILFTEMTTQLMLNYVTKTKYNRYRWLLLPLVGLVVATLICGDRLNEFIDTNSFLLMYMASSFVYLSFKIVLIIHEICNVLHIQCFAINKNEEATTTTMMIKKKT